MKEFQGVPQIITSLTQVSQATKTENVFGIPQELLNDSPIYYDS